MKYFHLKYDTNIDPNCKAQQVYEAEVQKALSSDDSIDSLYDYNDIKHVFKYALPLNLKSVEIQDSLILLH